MLHAAKDLEKRPLWVYFLGQPPAVPLLGPCLPRAGKLLLCWAAQVRPEEKGLEAQAIPAFSNNGASCHYQPEEIKMQAGAGRGCRRLRT